MNANSNVPLIIVLVLTAITYLLGAWLPFIVLLLIAAIMLKDRP